MQPKKTKKILGQKKTLIDKLMYPYRVVVHDEINFAEKWAFHITTARLVVYIFLLFVLFSSFSIFLVFALSGKKGLDVSRSEYEQLLEVVEDLEAEIATRDKFLADFQKSLRGEQLSQANFKQDSSFRPLKPDEKQLNTLDSSEIALRQQFESQRSEQSISLNETAVYLFPPIEGIISRGFIAKSKHYGIDIVSKKNESIKAVADGSVIMATWTRDAGYVIGIQHNNQMISFYKHNSLLYRQVGDLVKAGDIIGVVGNSGEYTDGPHLHFELWYMGTAIDQQNFISF